MKTLEIIHLRLAGNGPENLIDIICDSVGTVPGLTEAKIYRHLKVQNDVAIHLCRKDGGSENDVSDTGLRLAALLKDFGMVSHSIWTECCCVGEASGSVKTR